MMFFRKSKSIALLVISFLLLGFVGGAFKDDQMRYQRVRTAYEQKLPDVKQTLSNHNISNENLNVYIRVFKQEGELELWGKNRSGEKFQLLIGIEPHLKKGSYTGMVSALTGSRLELGFIF